MVNVPQQAFHSGMRKPATASQMPGANAYQMSHAAGPSHTQSINSGHQSAMPMAPNSNNPLGVGNGMSGMSLSTQATNTLGLAPPDHLADLTSSGSSDAGYRGDDSDPVPEVLAGEHVLDSSRSVMRIQELVAHDHAVIGLNRPSEDRRSFQFSNGQQQTRVEWPYYSEFKNRYMLMEMAGSGSFGSVFRAYDTLLDKWVALKFQTVPNADAEIDLLRTMSKRKVQNIVRTYGYFDEEASDINLRCMVMEWYHLTLSDVSRGRVPAAMKDQTSRVSLKLLISIAKDLAYAVETLHSSCMIHCDIKPCNVLIRIKSITPPCLEARLADMGSARDNLRSGTNEATYIFLRYQFFLNPDRNVSRQNYFARPISIFICSFSNPNRWFDDYIVTRNYRAPEVMFSLELSFGLDLWALGVYVIIKSGGPKLLF